jgi:hypothetical protein
MQTSIKRMPSRKVAASACSKGILVPCSRTDQQPQCLQGVIRAGVGPAGAASVNCHQLLDITGSIKFFSIADELERFVRGAALPLPKSHHACVGRVCSARSIQHHIGYHCGVGGAGWHALTGQTCAGLVWALQLRQQVAKQTQPLSGFN